MVVDNWIKIQNHHIFFIFYLYLYNEVSGKQLFFCLFLVTLRSILNMFAICTSSVVLANKFLLRNRMFEKANRYVVHNCKHFFFIAKILVSFSSLGIRGRGTGGAIAPSAFGPYLLSLATSFLCLFSACPPGLSCFRGPCSYDEYFHQFSWRLDNSWEFFY